MAQRDYVGRGRSGAARRKTPSRKKRSSPKVSKTVVVLAVALLVVFIGGLYFITHSKSEDAPLMPTHGNHPGSSLPPKPEERWRYIKELENRQIGVQRPTEPTAGGEINSRTQLTNEQRQLLAQMQADMQQRPTQLSEVPYNGPSPLRPNGNRPQPTQQTQPIQQTPPRPVVQPRNPFSNGATAPASQPPRQQATPQPKPQVAVPPASQPTTEVKPETAKPEQKKWMVQCGSFRSAEQAGTIRAQLAFAGIESRVTSGGGWNRVMLGPYTSRAAADKSLARLKGAGMASCIPLAVGG